MIAYIEVKLFFAVLAWAILPLDFRIDFGLYYFRSWRLLTIAYGSFFIIAAILLSFGPESPKFLMSQGKHDEALKVLQTIYAGNKGKSPEDYPVSICLLLHCSEISKVYGSNGNYDSNYLCCR